MAAVGQSFAFVDRVKAGQTFYEEPTDVHLVGRNASNTEPARFVVVLLKGKGLPSLRQ